MKKTERTGKAFRIKWLLLAVVAMALIFMPAASQNVYVTDKKCYAEYQDQASGSSESCRLSESWMDHDQGKQQGGI